MVLGGGLPRHRMYLVQGEPGAGKTTFGIQFLLEGLRRSEKVLYISFSESRDELASIAASHGWTLDGLQIMVVQMGRRELEATDQYTVFHPAEIELGSVMNHLLDEIKRIKPDRLVIDSLSEMRLLAGEPLRYRRQILALKEAMAPMQCTVVLLDTCRRDETGAQFETLVYGAIALDQFVPAYGRKRRRLRLAKLRGVNFDDGYHDYKIETGGMVVYPRLVAADHRMKSGQELVPSGVKELDTLLGGGMVRGSSTLVMGAAGTGKTTFSMQYVLAAAQRGERVAVYTFDESLEMYLSRARGMGIPLEQYVHNGQVTIQTVDPGELAPGEFIHRVRTGVDREGVRMVIIDSLNGYLHATPDERFLTVQLHELLTYMADRRVLTILVVAQQGLFGTDIDPPVEISYLADSVILLRYFEHAGRVRQAISVVKKRYGSHERTVRELLLGHGGLRVGEPLNGFRGVLTGMPEYEGDGQPLL